MWGLKLEAVNKLPVSCQILAAVQKQLAHPTKNQAALLDPTPKHAVGQGAAVRRVKPVIARGC